MRSSDRVCSHNRIRVLSLTAWRRLARALSAGWVAAPSPVDGDTVNSLAQRLDGSGQPLLGRSLAILHVDAGSCGGCEIELRAVRRAVYDLERFGMRFVSSPRHADVLLVTGPLTRNLVEALEQAYAATPDPKLVVAVGDCAVDGGVFKGSYAVTGGVGTNLPVDLLISGCPPAPERILAGLRALLEANARSKVTVSSR
jgi:Ni,Fe-hydrogenase III small subunit